MEQSNIPCGVVRDLLPLYAEDMTGGESRALIESHLPTCPTCRKELASIQSPPAPAPRATASLRNVNRGLRRKKLLAASAAALAVLLASLMAMGFAGKTSIRVTKEDYIVCERAATNVRLNAPQQWKELFLKAPYDTLLSSEVETRRVRGDVDHVEQVVFFSGCETPKSRWLFRTYGKPPFNSGPQLDFDRYEEDAGYVYSQPEIGIEGVTGPYPGQESAPVVLTAHTITTRVYFVPYDKWAAFVNLDPFSPEALAMAQLLWDREADAYDVFRHDSGGELVAAGRHEAGTPLE